MYDVHCTTYNVRSGNLKLGIFTEYRTNVYTRFIPIKDFPKERYTTLYLYVKSFFNHNAFEKMVLLVMIHI